MIERPTAIVALVLAVACRGGREQSRPGTADSTAAPEVVLPLPAAREFRVYYAFNQLAPPHQWTRIVHGRLDADRCAIVDSLTDSLGTRAGSAALTGADRTRCLTLLRDTKLEGLRVTEMPMDGRPLDVALTDTAGRVERGLPTNRAAWEEFIDRLPPPAPPARP